MRTLVIIAEGGNHAQINPPSTHSRCVHFECEAVEVGPLGTSGSAARQRVSKLYGILLIFFVPDPPFPNRDEDPFSAGCNLL